MKVVDQVANILKVSEKARNSDRELFIIYLQKIGFNLNEHQIDLLRTMPSFETIRRSRQLLQEQGKYPASEKVNEDRFAKYKAMRDGGHTNPEETLEPPAKVYKPMEWGL